MKKIIYIIIFLVGFNFFYSGRLISKNCILRRIRSIGDSKEEMILNHFIQRLTNRLGDKILSVYLIPSRLREEEESIDVIVIFDKMKKRRFRSMAWDIIYELYREYGELIFFAPLPKKEIFEEFDRYFSAAPLWQIFEAGTYLYFGPNAKDSFIEVSEKFIYSAEEELEEGNFRNSFFSLYYAVLSLLNASVGEREGYPKDRPDIFEQFRENFILTEKVPVEWSEKIDRLRELNKKLNQNPDIVIGKKELTSLIDFLRELYLYVKD